MKYLIAFRLTDNTRIVVQSDTPSIPLPDPHRVTSIEFLSDFFGAVDTVYLHKHGNDLLHELLKPRNDGMYTVFAHSDGRALLRRGEFQVASFANRLEADKVGDGMNLLHQLRAEKSSAKVMELLRQP